MMAAFGLEARRMIARHRGRDRAHIDDHGAGRHGGRNAEPEQNLGDDGPVVEHGDDDIGAPGGLGRAGGEHRPRCLQRFGLGGGAVPHGDGKAGAEQAPRHRRAHQPGAEQSNFKRCGHWNPPGREELDARRFGRKPGQDRNWPIQPMAFTTISQATQVKKPVIPSATADAT
jgi:hypothetical protein